MSPVFHTKRGQLTPYALGCGYIEKHEREGVTIQLWKEHSTYHVRSHTNGKRIGWDVFARLGEARKLYNCLIQG